MLPSLFARLPRIVLVLLALSVTFFPAHAAQFTADLTITSPQDSFVYDLKVQDNMIRLEKTKGPMNVPSFPTIYNRSTGVTWGLNPQVQQYVEETDPVKTMMMNPIIGWEFMRRNLEVTPAGTETIEGYSCQILEYRQHGDTRVANRVWVSPELDFTLKEVSYALNGDATLALKNIKKGPVDPALFEIPPGYSKVVIEKAPGGDNTENNVEKSAKDEKPLSKTMDVKRMSVHFISLKPDRHIIITATGNSPGVSVSSAYIKVLDKGNNEIIAEKITLKNGEIRTWEVTPDKEPWDLSLSGEKGLIKFKIDQLTDEPASALQTPQTAIEKPMAASAPEESASPGNLMFILDASGSMWGQVEGTAKIVIAKEVLTDLIQGLPDDAVVGLVTYGHRRKGDCDDVEELIPLGPLNKQEMIAQVQKLNPKGKTPISRSVRLTAERIKHLEDETTIILVSDGKETCDPDPCGLVKELKASGIKFIMHVIGFDVTEEEKQELECMALEGGGQYYTAGNAKDFQLAAQEVVKKASEKPPVSLKVTSLKEGQPFEARVDVYRHSDNERMGGQNTWRGKQPAEFKLVPGIYRISVLDSSVTPNQKQEIRDIEIVSGQTVEKTLTFGAAGILRITAVKEGQPFEARADVYRQSDNERMGGQNTWRGKQPAEFKLVPGIYRISVLDSSVTPNQKQEIRDIEIVSGQTVEKTLTFGAAGILRITAVKEGQPFEARADVYRQSDNERMGGQNTWRGKQPAEFKLVPGIYRISVLDSSVTPNQKQEIRDIEIVSGQTVEKTLTFGAAGILRITAVKEGQPFEARADVYRQSDNERMGGQNTWRGKQPAEFKLVPGIYRISVLDSSVTPNQKQEIRDIEIVSGQTVEKTLTFGAAGILRITAVKEGQPFEARADVYRQSDNERMGGQNTWRGKQPAEFKLVPGIYRISVLDSSVTPNQKQEIRDIEIVSGQTVEKTLTFGAAGILRITAVKEGQPFEARADVYRQSDNERMGGQNTWRGKQPAEFKLVPGIYRISVLDSSVTPNQKQEIRDIEIVSGQTVEKTLTFGAAGILRITAVKEGQPFEARADVYRQSDNERMGGQNTWRGKQPAEFKLVPGIYRISVLDSSVTPNQKQEIRDIEIVSGQTVEKTLTFGAAGILRITAVKEGQPFEARADVYRQSDNERMGGQNTWRGKQPAEFKLVPGIYRISVLDSSVTPNQKQEIRDIEIVSGQTVEKTVVF